jgi:hypothetical protein
MEIKILSFNPYAHKFPERKVISRAQVNFMKYMRSKGHDVVVVPDNDQPVHMLAQKNISESLPMILELVSTISMGVFSGLLTTYLASKSSSGSSERIVVKKRVNQGYEFYDQNGNDLKVEEVEEFISPTGEVQNRFGESFSIQSPYPGSPHALYREHAGVIIGWCSASTDEVGMKIDNIVITNKNAKEAIKNGSLRGASFGGIVRKAVCSICYENYINCGHFTSRKYEGESCTCMLEEIDLAEISLVASPANPLCEITYK